MRRYFAFCLRARRIALGTLIVLWGTFFLYLLHSWGWSWASYLAPILYLALAPAALIRLPRDILGEVYAVESMTKMAKFCAYSPAYLIMSLAALVVSIGFSAHLIALAIPTGSPASVSLPQTAASALPHTVGVFYIENATVINGTYVFLIRDLNSSAQFVVYARPANASLVEGPQILHGYIIVNSAILSPLAKLPAAIVGLYVSLAAAAIYTALFAVLPWGKAEEMQEAVRLAKEAYEKAKRLLA